MKINEFYHHLKGKDDFVTRNHSHGEVELIECVCGSGSVLKSDRSYPLKDRHLYIIDARRPHIVYPTDCDGYIRNKIVVDAESFLSFLQAAGLSGIADRLFNSPPVSTAGRPEIDRLFGTVADLCRSASAEECGFAHGYILQIVHFAAAHSESAPISAAPEGFIEQSLKIIAEADGITSLQQISRQFNLNKYYLCHLFKEKTGITLSEYIAEKRYEKSLRLLRDTGCTMDVISARCGFASASSFTRFFRKKSGLSPSEYRKKLRAGAD